MIPGAKGGRKHRAPGRWGISNQKIDPGWVEQVGGEKGEDGGGVREQRLKTNITSKLLESTARDHESRVHSDALALHAGMRWTAPAIQR